MTTQTRLDEVESRLDRMASRLRRLETEAGLGVKAPPAPARPEPPAATAAFPASSLPDPRDRVSESPRASGAPAPDPASRSSSVVACSPG